MKRNLLAALLPLLTVIALPAKAENYGDYYHYPNYSAGAPPHSYQARSQTRPTLVPTRNNLPAQPAPRTETVLGCVCSEEYGYRTAYHLKVSILTNGQVVNYPLAGTPFFSKAECYEAMQGYSRYCPDVPAQPQPPSKPERTPVQPPPIPIEKPKVITCGPCQFQQVQGNYGYGYFNILENGIPNSSLRVQVGQVYTSKSADIACRELRAQDSRCR